MSPLFAVAIFFIIWWVVLFAVLPIGIRTQAEAGEVVPGTPASAPANLRLLRVVTITTIVAGLIFAAVYAVIALKLVGIEDLTFLPL